MALITLSRPPISRAGRLSTASTTYAQVTSWAVTAGKLGRLNEVSMVTDQFSATQYRLTIAGQQQWSNAIFQASLSIPYRGAKLAPSDVVLLEARSADGTAIVVDGSIAGEEE